MIPAAGGEPAVQPKRSVESESKEAWGPKLKPNVAKESETIPVPAEREHTQDWENTGLSKVR